MTDTIPLPAAVLILWPAGADTPAFRCQVRDGDLPPDRADKLKALGGYQRPFVAGERAEDVWRMFALSPGWHDHAEVAREFARVGFTIPPTLCPTSNAAIAARRAIIGDATGWDAVRKLAKVGECSPAVAREAGV